MSRCGAITALFERLYQNPYRGALGRLHEESLTLGLLVELAAYLGGADLRRARTPRAQRDLAHEARRLLEANLGEPPASLELARQLGVGETTLRRIFKNEFGRSMLQYVRDRRLEIGRQMVREGRWQIAQIAWFTPVRKTSPMPTARASAIRRGASEADAVQSERWSTRAESCSALSLRSE